MVDIEKYIAELITELKNKFHTRLVYVGLQGSYLRGEATENSDIDIMVVIDHLTIADLDIYRHILQNLENFDKSCGFICSKDDLANWNPLEICHLLHTTKDYWGTLNTIVPIYTKQDIRNFIIISVNNLYHELCHRYIHSYTKHDIAHLSNSYKGVFFILQNLHYLANGEFITTKAELLSCLEGKHRAILERSIELNSGIVHDLSESFHLLFTWCQEILQYVSNI